MPSRTIKGAGFSEDILFFLRLLSRHRVRFLVVGGEAVIFHGYPRVTGDIDFFYENTPANARRLHAALLEFWAGRIPGVRSAEELREPGVILQFGRPPHRIDLMNQIDGVSFRAAWPSRVRVRLATRSGPVAVPYMDLSCLLKNKRAAGRAKDLEDLRYLSARARREQRRARKRRKTDR